MVGTKVTYEERIMNLFDIGMDYYICHCISSDAKMGRGITVEIDKAFGTKSEIMRDYGKTLMTEFQKDVSNGGCGGTCVVCGRVINLVTKEWYWHKPTYSSMRQALRSMKDKCEELGITKVAMPKIGCGLDKLDWGKVRDIIFDVFDDSDIEILVCVYGGDEQ